MDPDAVVAAFADTLSPHAAVRSHAEAALDQAITTPGFAFVLLNIVMQEHIAFEIRLAVSIFFKNTIHRCWYDSDSEPPDRFRLSAEDRTTIKTHLVEAVVYADPRIQVQLLRVMNEIITSDYPEEWPRLLPDILRYLNNHGDQKSLFGGLLCLYELVKKYEYKSEDTRDDLMLILQSTFPLLYKLIAECVKLDQDEAATVVVLVERIFMACTQHALPPELMKGENVRPWLIVFLQCLDRPIPQDTIQRQQALPDDEKYKLPWWKAKKRACNILNRMLMRYGDPAVYDSKKKENKALKNFCKMFQKNFAPEILRSYLKQLELYQQGQYLSPRVLMLSLSYLAECMAPAVTWKMLKKIIVPLLTTVAFPLICHSAADQELWEEDPYEYVHQKFDVLNEFKSPVTSARSLLHFAVKLRRKDTLGPVLHFCQEILLRYQMSPPAERNYVHKDGVLYMLGTLAVLLVTDEALTPQLEQLLVVHVLPEINCPAPFLRARAFWTLHAFSELDMKDKPNLVTAATQFAAQGLKDPELPVKIQAALALSSLLSLEEVQRQVRPILPELLQALLVLANESDLDDLVSVLETFIETFAEEMTPYAVQLCTQMRDSFFRMTGEGEEEDDDGNSDEYQKTLAAMGLLRAQVTLVRALDDAPEVLAQLEHVFLPTIEFIISRNLFDMYQEMLEIVAACTYNSKHISPIMWSVFPMLYNTFKVAAFDYFSDMTECLTIYIDKDPDVFLANPANFEMMYDMIQSILNEDRSGQADQSQAFKLIEVLLLSCRGKIDNAVESFLAMASRTLSLPDLGIALRISAMETMINAIYYNPTLALGILNEKSFLQPFFQAWFQRIDEFSRVHDKKISILALCTLFSLPTVSLPQLVQENLQQAFLVCLRLFETLPAAYQRREEAIELFNSYGQEEEEDDDGEAEEEEEGDEQDEGADDDEDAVDPGDEAYLKALAEKEEELKKGWEEEEGELEEDLQDISAVLDSVNEYIFFQDTMQHLQAQLPQNVAVLTSGLDANRQGFVNAIFAKATEIRATPKEED